MWYGRKYKATATAKWLTWGACPSYWQVSLDISGAEGSWNIGIVIIPSCQAASCLAWCEPTWKYFSHSVQFADVTMQCIPLGNLWPFRVIDCNSCAPSPLASWELNLKLLDSQSSPMPVGRVSSFSPSSCHHMLLSSSNCHHMFLHHLPQTVIWRLWEDRTHAYNWMQYPLQWEQIYLL